MNKTPKTLSNARMFTHPLWIDVLKGAGCALDPNPAPVTGRRWHDTAAKAFNENFRVLAISRENAMRKLTHSWKRNVQKGASVGQSARETEAA